MDFLKRNGKYILFLTVFKVVTNADNENKGATVTSGENTQNEEPVESGK